MKTLFAIILTILLAFSNVFAQQLYMPRTVKNAIAAGTRSADGKPGKNYWQNKATYNIKVAVAPPNRTVNGTEEITYVNNSPDTLRNLVFRLTMNGHSPQAARERSISADYVSTGVQIDEYTENGKVKAWRQQIADTAQGVRLDNRSLRTNRSN